MKHHPIISDLINQILDFSNPIKIILYNKKININDELTSFKLCVIVPDDTNIPSLESKLYLELNCENPFNVLIYKISEWDCLIEDDTSFASTILKTGVCVYELQI